MGITSSILSTPSHNGRRWSVNSSTSTPGEANDASTLLEAVLLFPHLCRDGGIDPFAVEPCCGPALLARSARAGSRAARPARPGPPDQIRRLAKVLLQDARHEQGLPHHHQWHLGYWSN